MQLHDVAILGFRLNAPEPPEKALVRVFGIEPELARSLVKSFPVVVKHGVPREVAESVANALIAIGARVEVRANVPAPTTKAQAPSAPVEPPVAPVSAPEPRPLPAEPRPIPAERRVTAPPSAPLRTGHATIMQAGLVAAPVAPPSTSQHTVLQRGFDPAELAAEPRASPPEATRDARFATAREIDPRAAPPASAPAPMRAPVQPELLRSFGALDLAPGHDEPLFSAGELALAPFAEARPEAPLAGAPQAAFSDDFDAPLRALMGTPPDNSFDDDDARFTAAPSSAWSGEELLPDDLPMHAPPARETPAGSLADDGLPLELAFPAQALRTQELTAALAAVPRELLTAPALLPPREPTSRAAPTRTHHEAPRAPESPAKAPVFGADLALPWLDSDVARAAASVRPPGGAAPSYRPSAPSEPEGRPVRKVAPAAPLPAAPRLETQAAQTTPFAPVLKGPVPIPPSRELGPEVLAELPQDAEGTLRSYGIALGVVVLALLCFALGATLTGVLMLVLAVAAGIGAGAYESARAELSSVLEPASSRSCAEAELYLRGYERWARHYGFGPLCFYRRPGTRELLGCFAHQTLPAYFAVRLTQKGALWELVSMFEGEQTLVTTSAPFVLPPPARSFRQSFTGAPLERLITQHGQAHDFVRVRARLEPLATALPFEQSFASVQTARSRALAVGPLWPLWLVPWRMVLPHQLGERPVTRSP